jgi:hypothetical protein
MAVRVVPGNWAYADPKPEISAGTSSTCLPVAVERRFAVLLSCATAFYFVVPKEVMTTSDEFIGELVEIMKSHTPGIDPELYRNALTNLVKIGRKELASGLEISMA